MLWLPLVTALPPDKWIGSTHFVITPSTGRTDFTHGVERLRVTGGEIASVTGKHIRMYDASKGNRYSQAQRSAQRSAVHDQEQEGW